MTMEKVFIRPLQGGIKGNLDASAAGKGSEDRRLTKTSTRRPGSRSAQGKTERARDGGECDQLDGCRGGRRNEPKTII